MFTLLITRNVIYEKYILGLSATIPSITIEDVIEKLHKLRTQYQKYFAKIRSNSRIEVGLEDVCKQRL